MSDTSWQLAKGACCARQGGGTMASLNTLNRTLSVRKHSGGNMRSQTDVQIWLGLILLTSVICHPQHGMSLMDTFRPFSPLGYQYGLTSSQPGLTPLSPIPDLQGSMLPLAIIFHCWIPRQAKGFLPRKIARGKLSSQNEGGNHCNLQLSRALRQASPDLPIATRQRTLHPPSKEMPS